MIIKCTCSDLVNNGDHYCPIHGMFAKPTPPEGEADPLSPLLDMSVVEGLSEELRKAKAEGETVTEQAKCKTCDGKGVVRDTETELVVDCPECDNPNPQLPREEWIPCPICQSEYDGVYCHACRNHPAAPVVSTAAPEPLYTEQELKDQGLVAVKTDYGKEGSATMYVPVAPESYKPAEGPERKGIVFSDKGIEICKEIVARELEKNPENFKAACAILGLQYELPAATPVTVEAPKGEKWVELPESEMQKAQRHIFALLSGIWPEDGFDSVEDVQAELKRLRATPKPIGDVEARIRIIDRNEEPTCVQVKVEDDWYTVCKDINLDTALRVREVLKKFALSPFFAPQRPCSECATPSSPMHLNAEQLRGIRNKIAEGDAGMYEAALLLQHIDSIPDEFYRAKWNEEQLTGLVEQQKSICATLRKERDEARAAVRYECEQKAIAIEQSLIDSDRAEAAEAHISTLRDALDQGKKAINAAGHKTSCGFSGCTCGEVDTFKSERLEFFRKLAALAPTPEVAKEGKL